MMIDRLRKAAPTIFLLPPAVFGESDGAKRAREECTTVWKDYLGLSSPTGTLDALFPPILFRDENCSDKSGLFLNTVLFDASVFSFQFVY